MNNPQTNTQPQHNNNSSQNASNKHKNQNNNTGSSNNNNNKQFQQVPLCRHFVKGYCEHGKICKYRHDDQACKFYYFDGVCEDTNCKYSHEDSQVENPQKYKYNNNSNKQQYQHKQHKEKREDNKEDLFQHPSRSNQQQQQPKQHNNNRNNIDDKQNNNFHNNKNNTNNNNEQNYHKNKNNNNNNYNNRDKQNNDSGSEDEYGYKNSRNYNGQKNRNNYKGQGKITNTENFEPSYKPADVKIRTVIYFPQQTYNKPIETREVILVPNRFSQDVTDMTFYNNLMKEIEQSGFKDDMWKLWHGDSHLIADDKLNWKKKCPTFDKVINAIKDYFKMDVKATRLNWYRDSAEWKPFHFDAAAVKPDKAKQQNITVGVSFGAERDLAFEHADTKTVVSFPQTNGIMFAFSKDVNNKWRHGVPQVNPKNQHKNGRISIIAWGWVDDMVEAC